MTREKQELDKTLISYIQLPIALCAQAAPELLIVINVGNVSSLHNDYFAHLMTACLYGMTITTSPAWISRQQPSQAEPLSAGFTSYHLTGAMAGAG